MSIKPIEVTKQIYVFFERQHTLHLDYLIDFSYPSNVLKTGILTVCKFTYLKTPQSRESNAFLEELAFGNYKFCFFLIMQSISRSHALSYTFRYIFFSNLPQFHMHFMISSFCVRFEYYLIRIN